MSKTAKIIFTVCRIALAAVFIFSGFMKGLDSWGTAQKVGEYLTSFGFDFLFRWRAVLGILLAAAEFTLGMVLLFRVKLRLTSLIAFIVMIGFTVLTLCIAIWNPLDDCGCFGEALVISNWQSFFKNLLLLALVFIVWRSSRKLDYFPIKFREIAVTLVFIAVGVGFGLYNYRHLPVIDMFSYKVGDKIGRDVICTKCTQDGTVLVYRNLKTGELAEFSMHDTEWWDEQQWEFVDARNILDDLDEKSLEEDFALWRDNENIADRVAGYEGTVGLIIVREPEKLGEKCMENLTRYTDRILNIPAARALCVIGAEDGEKIPATVRIGVHEIECVAMKPVTLGLMLRADAGALTIENGVVESKQNCKNIK